MHVCKANILSNPQWYFKREDDNLYTENGVTEGYQSGMGFPGGASGTQGHKEWDMTEATDSTSRWETNKESTMWKLGLAISQKPRVLKD